MCVCVQCGTFLLLLLLRFTRHIVTILHVQYVRTTYKNEVSDDNECWMHVLFFTLSSSAKSKKRVTTKNQVIRILKGSRLLETCAVGCLCVRTGNLQPGT